MLKAKKLHRVFLLLLYVILAAALLRSFYVPPSSPVRYDENILELSEFWEKRVQDHSVTYTYTVPMDIESGLTLLVNNNSIPFQLFLDDMELYSYQDPYNDRGMSVQQIVLPKDSNGKSLCFVVYPLASDDAQIFQAFLGSESEVFLYLLFQNIPSLIFSSLSILLGAIVFFVYLILYKKRLRESDLHSLPHLGIFLTLSGIWIFTDSYVSQFFTGHTGTVTFISFFSFMLMPYFLLRFIRYMFSEDPRIFRIFSWLYLANAGLCAVGYTLRVFPLYYSLPTLHLLILITVILIILLGIREVRKCKSTQIRIIVRGLAFLFFFGLIALGTFYANFTAPYSLLYGIGILIFDLHLIIAVLNSFYQYILKSTEGKIYQELAYTDAMTHLGNRTAFLELQEQPLVHGASIICIIIDINNLKTVNDTWGHQEGDRLICDAAECIRQVFDGIGNCYRIGGDEFTVILKDIPEEEAVQRLMMLEQYIQTKNLTRSFPFSVACGYAADSGTGYSLKDLFAEADSRMYQKKQKMKAENSRKH